MKRQVPLATRAFLFAFIPMALTLVVSFVLVSKAVEGRIKVRLRESLRKTELTMSRKDAEYTQRNIKVLTALTENPSLKAGIGLLRETREANLQEQVHETLARQLQQIGESLDSDLLLLENASEEPIVGVMGKQRARLLPASHHVAVISSSLIRVDGILFEVASVPINQGEENLGILTVGREFSVNAWNEFGNTALIQDGKIVLSNFSPGQVVDVERQVQRNCAQAAECEIELGGETYLTMPVRQETFNDGVRLISFQSIDSAAKDYTQSLTSVFPLIGGGGMLLVLVFSTLGAQYIASPLVSLIAQLRHAGSAGGYSAELKTDYQAAEVNELALEFVRAAGAVRESERRLDEATEQFLESMSQAQDARDPYTNGHSERVSTVATSIAKAMGLQPAQIEIIRIGAKLHDIGKIGVPDAVLRKPGKLTREEYALIQRHPQVGKEILEKVGRFNEFLPIVELHHENPDGSGYPYGLRKGDIPLGVRIVHVADVYDAITTDRAYRKAMSYAQAWDLIRKGTGPLFDPEVVEALKIVVEGLEPLNVAACATGPHENDLAFYPLPLFNT